MEDAEGDQNEIQVTNEKAPLQKQREREPAPTPPIAPLGCFPPQFWRHSQASLTDLKQLSCLLSPLPRASQHRQAGSQF